MSVSFDPSGQGTAPTLIGSAEAKSENTFPDWVVMRPASIAPSSVRHDRLIDPDLHELSRAGSFGNGLWRGSDGGSPWGGRLQTDARCRDRCDHRAEERMQRARW